MSRICIRTISISNGIKSAQISWAITYNPPRIHFNAWIDLALPFPVMGPQCLLLMGVIIQERTSDKVPTNGPGHLANTFRFICISIGAGGLHIYIYQDAHIIFLQYL